MVGLESNPHFRGHGSNIWRRRIGPYLNPTAIIPPWYRLAPHDGRHYSRDPPSSRPATALLRIVETGRSSCRDPLGVPHD